MAKGVEDTAFYRYTRFVALNEVGNDPAHFGLVPGDFHAAQQARQASVPAGMTTLSTHDTKRGEDVRARLAVLSEVPDEWASLVSDLMRAAPLPDASFAYLLWQTFAGTGFIERERMHAYAEKAMREAAVSTTWTRRTRLSSRPCTRSSTPPTTVPTCTNRSPPSSSASRPTAG